MELADFLSTQTKELLFLLIGSLLRLRVSTLSGAYLACSNRFVQLLDRGNIESQNAS